MARRSCDGAGLLDAFAAAVERLEAHADEVNGLNVFPVPDGDTGNNMVATVHAALDEGRRAADTSADRVAAAIAHGALMGARGNSGVITSQILRGLADGLAGKRRFNGLDLAHALREGSRTAYGAVARPVEGTILTVIREAAEAAVARAEQTNDVEAVLATTVEAAEHSVARTPTLLPVLREAGVVDSGGQGLYRLLEGALLHLTDRVPAPPAAARAATVPLAPQPPAPSHAEDGFGYETMFLLQAFPGGSLDVDGIRLRLEELGESVLVAGDARAVKVHVHNDRPDQVIGYGLTLGTLSRISVENLDHQARDVREERAAAFTLGGASAGQGAGHAMTGDGEGIWTAAPVAVAPPTVAPPTVAPPTAAPSAVALAPMPGRGALGSAGGPATSEERRLALGVVVVAPGEGLIEVFEQFRVPDQLAVAIVRGGQAHNPSIGELLDAIIDLPANEVIVLPNNPNVVLAARQVAAIADRPCEVVPTRNAAEGVAALLALEPLASAADNLAPMTMAGRAIQSMQVTEAVRDARIGDRKVRKGQTIVLDPDDGLIAADGDRTRAVLAGVASFTPGFELVTVYYGDGADLDEAEAIARRIGARLDGAEVQLVHGGQPYYRYLISAE
jgi:DAK2 domain fusion protein YloV